MRLKQVQKKKQIELKNISIENLKLVDTDTGEDITKEVIDDLEQTKKNEEKVKEFILSCTNISEDLYDKNYRKNWWLDSSEIIKYGLADHVIENIEELF